MERHKQYQGKKVVVTGAAGFIGSHLCEALVNVGANVIGLDDLSAGKLKNVAFLRGRENFKFIQKSINSIDEEMDDIFNGAYAVFNNAASKKNICLLDPQKDLLVNGGGALNLLGFAKKHGVERFVHASTGSVYGEPVVFPTTEDHPLRPVSYYGVSKLAGERYVDAFHRLYGMKTTILRYFHVYGSRQESNEFGGVVSIFARNILERKPLFVNGDGGQVRSFTYVKDLINANLAAGLENKAIGQVYNVASGIQVTINELAENIRRMMRSNVPILHNDPLIGDIRYFDVSNRKVVEELGVVFAADFWATLESSLNDLVGSIG
jgi:nucleoside-diphosphate-sugar epimerase